MGAKTNLALVRGVQVMAIALLVVMAYTSTMGFLKQKKIDFVAIGRKFISDKFFLFKDRKKRKNDLPKQYTYCI